jgi:hypothetical protein
MVKDTGEHVEIDLTQFENEIIVQAPEASNPAHGASRHPLPPQANERNMSFRQNVDHFHPVMTPA